MKPFDSEPSKLRPYEAVMEKWRTPFVEAGLALGAICSGRRYREEYESFEAYCRAKWDYGRRDIDQLISASQLFRYLRANSSQRNPDH